MPASYATHLILFFQRGIGGDVRISMQRFGYVTFLARATDDRGNVQPITSHWNPLGYFWNGIHRVGVMVVPG